MKSFLRFFVLMSLFPLMLSAQNQVIIADYDNVTPPNNPGPGIWNSLGWGGTMLVIDNPVKDQNNNTNRVLHYVKDGGEWSGFLFNYEDGLTVTSDLESIELLIYGVQWTKLSIIVEGSKNGNNKYEFATTPAWPWNAPSAGTWHKIVMPIKPTDVGGTIKTIAVMCADAGGQPFDIYFDELKLNYSGYVAVQSVSLNKNTLNLFVNDEELLEATITPANATNKNVTWTSSNTSVATVDQLGMVTAIAPGTAIITVTTEDGGKTATCQVTVDQTTGIHSTAIQKSSLYPNPLSGSLLYVAVPSASSGSVQFRIMDVSGRIVQSFSSPVNGRHTYELSVRLVPGNYLLQVMSEGVNDVMKLIVK